MDLKTEIIEKEKTIKSLLNEFSEVKNEIESIRKNSALKNNIRKASRVQMNTSDIATATMLNNNAKAIEDEMSEKLSDLKRRELELSSKITRSKEELKNLYQQYRLSEYNSRPEANLLVEKNAIYVQGDSSKTNVFDKIVEIKIAGVNEVRRLVEYDDVERYYEIFNNLTSFKNFSKLPKATPELLKELENLKSNYNIPPFNYFVYNGRVAVDRDFLSGRTSDLAQMASILYGEIDKNNDRLKDYKPSFWMKLNKKNEQKRESLESEVKAENEKHNKKIKDIKTEVDKYTDLIQTIITPSTDIMSNVEEISTLLQSNEKLEGYIKKIDTFKEGLKNNTFLRDIGYKDITQMLPQRVLNYLNENHLKISEENLIKVLSASKQFKDIAVELENALSQNSNTLEKSL